MEYPCHHLQHKRAGHLLTVYKIEANTWPFCKCKHEVYACHCACDVKNWLIFEKNCHRWGSGPET